MGYLRKISSLEERASAQVAINLCQDSSFKELAMCLEKPTYGAFIRELGSRFVTDPDILSRYAKIKKATVKTVDQHCFFNFQNINLDKRAKERWDAVIDEQCQTLTERLPHFLKHVVHAWINRIALEYLSYGRRQEEYFGVSRYFLMNFLTPGDWTASGRLDEKKIGERLLKDELLTVLQRCRIACVYFLHVPVLWKRLTPEEKKWISENGNPRNSEETDRLVFLWSCQMNEQRDEKMIEQENRLWISAVQPSVCNGNRALLMSCWKKLKEHVRQQMVIDMALQSLRLWQHFQDGWWRKTLISNEVYDKSSSFSSQHFNLPSYYSELICFFLSEMDDELQLTFFNQVFQITGPDSGLECFLEWPHQDEFLPTINRLWGIIPKAKYEQCLLTLAGKYSGNNENENRYCDFRSLLWMLWENTPEEYKQHVFRDRSTSYKDEYDPMENRSMVLLRRLLEKSPFQEKDETLFKRVFCHQPQEERRAMIHSTIGENICSILVQNENWSLVNWLLESCLPKEEIPCYKKQLIQLDCCKEHCCSKLEDYNWFEEISFDYHVLRTERKQGSLNNKPIRGAFFSKECKTLLSKGNFTEVERMISFCLSSDKIKERIKVPFAKYTCAALLKKQSSRYSWNEAEDFVSVCERMNAILAWSVDSEKKIRNLKKDLFSREGMNLHNELLFFKNVLEEIECFYKWFGLSPAEIKKLKKGTVFSPDNIQRIEETLYGSTDMLIAPLRWCLTDQKMVIDLKKKVEHEFFKQRLDKKKRKAKKRLDNLVSELLSHLKKEEFQDKANRDGDMKEKKGEKRSSNTKNDSRSRRKRFK